MSRFVFDHMDEIHLRLSEVADIERLRRLATSTHLTDQNSTARADDLLPPQRHRLDDLISGLDMAQQQLAALRIRLSERLTAQPAGQPQRATPGAAKRRPGTRRVHCPSG